MPVFLFPPWGPGDNFSVSGFFESLQKIVTAERPSALFVRFDLLDIPTIVHFAKIGAPIIDPEYVSTP